MNLTVLKQSFAKTSKAIIDFIFHIYTGAFLSFILCMTYDTNYLELIIFDKTNLLEKNIPYPLTLFCGIALILSLLLSTNTIKKIFNGIFCLYTGYAISFFAMTIIYLVFSKIRSFFDHDFSYHSITSLPWMLIIITTPIFGILLFLLLRYLNQKEYIKIKTPDYAYKIIYMLLLPSCLFYSILSIMTNIFLFRQNFVWWSPYAFLPFFVYIATYINKYLAYILAIISLYPLF